MTHYVAAVEPGVEIGEVGERRRRPLLATIGQRRRTELRPR